MASCALNKLRRMFVDFSASQLSLICGRCCFALPVLSVEGFWSDDMFVVFHELYRKKISVDAPAGYDA